MHLEVQVALNFVISYLYNKLPRRRVNLFGEELEKALKQKFEGHWYPEKPFKGSAFRCLRVGSPVDPVIEQAARESGVEVADVREHLPDELSVWIDPGEVSYRIGEKGAVKVLYSEAEALADESAAAAAACSNSLDREVTRTFNPEAQCFKPIEAVAASMGGLSLASPNGANNANNNHNNNNNNNSTNGANNNGGNRSPFEAAPGSPPGFKSNSPIHAFIPKAAAPVTFTTATFAQTKFGSTKLKSSGKRSHRLSPTEFSNYIKQRAAIQQQMHVMPPPPQAQPRPRSLSPKPSLDPFLVMAAAAQSPPFGAYLGELANPGQFVGAAGAGAGAAAGAANGDSKTFLDNMALNSLPYSPQYQHLLVAN